MNLLKNAINYTKSYGTIKISLEQLPLSRGCLEITDTGIGIEKEKLARIFEPFYRTDSARSRDSGGSGLGLAIVSELIKLHHGKIIVKSTLGVGTTVYIELPTVSVLDEKTDNLTDEIIMDFSGQK
jgi:two-component system phosphate regulon sensor histidine kinase PhoR